MLSLIICSRNPDISNTLKENIKSTIGIEYELIVINNSKRKYSIFSAYNIGVQLAKYPYLCFMHDDILYHTNDWGKKVIDQFADRRVGLISVIGRHYLPCKPTYYHDIFISSGIFIYNDT